MSTPVQGQYRARTGFSLCSISTQGKPCFHYWDGFAASYITGKLKQSKLIYCIHYSISISTSNQDPWGSVSWVLLTKKNEI